MKTLIETTTDSRAFLIQLLEDLIYQDLDETGQITTLLQDIEAGGEV